MASLAHLDKYYQLYLSLGVGMGVGAGLLYVPAMAIQALHWPKRRALAMGVVITGTASLVVSEFLVYSEHVDTQDHLQVVSCIPLC